MPCTTITARVSLKDGVLSSKDLFIDSNAIQISGVGKVDFLKKELDNIIGVYPLQTLNFIVSKIFIAGWLITDERGKSITAYSKVDGAWDNPNVTPMAVQSIGKETLGIFRRFFQLPEKLIPAMRQD